MAGSPATRTAASSGSTSAGSWRNNACRLEHRSFRCSGAVGDGRYYQFELCRRGGQRVFQAANLSLASCYREHGNRIWI